MYVCVRAHLPFNSKWEWRDILRLYPNKFNADTSIFKLCSLLLLLTERFVIVMMMMMIIIIIIIISSSSSSSSSSVWI
jgi:hypothetical protein